MPNTTPELAKLAASVTFAENAVNAAPAHEIIIIDSAVPNFHDLIAGAKPGEQVFVLDGSHEGLGQIVDIIAANNLHDTEGAYASSVVVGGIIQSGTINTGEERCRR